MVGAGPGGRGCDRGRGSVRPRPVLPTEPTRPASALAVDPQAATAVLASSQQAVIDVPTTRGQAALATADRYAGHSHADATRRAYRSDWRWCMDRRLARYFYPVRRISSDGPRRAWLFGSCD